MSYGPAEARIAAEIVRGMGRGTKSQVNVWHRDAAILAAALAFDEPTGLVTADDAMVVHALRLGIAVFSAKP